jgi:hypothetical protein
VFLPVSSPGGDGLMWDGMPLPFVSSMDGGELHCKVKKYTHTGDAHPATHEAFSKRISILIQYMSAISANIASYEAYLAAT